MSALDLVIENKFEKWRLDDLGPIEKAHMAKVFTQGSHYRRFVDFWVEIMDLERVCNIQRYEAFQHIKDEMVDDDDDSSSSMFWKFYGYVFVQGLDQLESQRAPPAAGLLFKRQMENVGMLLISHTPLLLE
jgi:hypothetical protein